MLGPGGTVSGHPRRLCGFLVGLWLTRLLVCSGVAAVLVGLVRVIPLECGCRPCLLRGAGSWHDVCAVARVPSSFALHPLPLRAASVLLLVLGRRVVSVLRCPVCRRTPPVPVGRVLARLTGFSAASLVGVLPLWLLLVF